MQRFLNQEPLLFVVEKTLYLNCSIQICSSIFGTGLTSISQVSNITEYQNYIVHTHL